jgi:hypothetical protein
LLCWRAMWSARGIGELSVYVGGIALEQGV